MTSMNDDSPPHHTQHLARGRPAHSKGPAQLAPRPAPPTGRALSSEQLDQMFLRQLDATPRLSRREEVRLVRRIAEGDDGALVELVASHGWLLSHFARRYRGMGLEVIDLVQEGHIGLLRAAASFDAARGYRFATYAAWWVRQAMGRAVTNQGHAVRLPVHLRHAQRRLRRARSQFEQLHGRAPEPEELARWAGLTADAVETLDGVPRFPLSLETPPWDDGAPSIEERLPDERSMGPEEAVVRRRLQAEIREALGTLSEREQQVLRMRFGVGRRAGQSLQQVGTAFHLTRERIRQIERRALHKLRRGVHGRRLRAFTAPRRDAPPGSGGQP